jgi:hypothetical protein
VSGRRGGILRAPEGFVDREDVAEALGRRARLLLLEERDEASGRGLAQVGLRVAGELPERVEDARRAVGALADVDGRKRVDRPRHLARREAVGGVEDLEGIVGGELLEERLGGAFLRGRRIDVVVGAGGAGGVAFLVVIRRAARARMAVRRGGDAFAVR